MNPNGPFERDLEQWLQTEAPASAPAGFHATVMDRARTLRQRPGWATSLPVRRLGRGRGMTLLAAAALLLVGGAWAAGSGILRLPSVVPPVPAPSVVAVATASPDATFPSPSALAEPSAVPTASAAPGPAGVWIATGTMGEPRIGFTSVRLLDGRVLVAGGSGANFKYDLTSAELYDPESGTWSTTGNMVHPSAAFPAVLLRDGKVLVGADEDPAAPSWDDSITGAELYDPARGTWSATGTMVNGTDLYGGMTATLLANGKVLVAGDKGAELYDPASGTWSATGKMITPRHSHTATLMPDGKVLVAGGAVGDGRVYSAELYDPDTGSWAAIANTLSDGHCATGCPRRGGMATLLQDGSLLFIRTRSTGDEIDFAQIYDPATGRWTPTGDMARDAHYSTATRLLDGTVLVADGSNRPAEVFDPATGSWTETGNMLYDESSATLLLDGTVLMTGGHPADATNTAELYVPAGVSPPDLRPFPSPTPTQTPTPSPVPTPTPSPIPAEVGPVPAGARSWKVTVVNKSPEPATLFLAEEGENGMGQLCGNVTPNVVPAGVTEKVTLLLPPKTVKSCWIWVNPPQGGSLIQTSDAPLAGEIRIIPGEEGWSPVWVSP